MIKRAPDNLPLGIAIACSLALHAVAFGPLLMAVSAAPEPEPLWDDASAADTSPDRIPLGLDEGVPSSLTWIGFTEYEKHLAELAETDQAAFTMATAPIVPPMDMVEPTDAEPEPAEPVESTVLEPAEPGAPEPGNPAESMPALPAVDLAPIGDFVATIRDETDLLFDAAQDQLTRAWQSLRQARPQRRTPAESPETESPPTDETGSTPAEQPVAPPPTDDEPPRDEQATPADRESDATSIITVERDQWQAGKPLAARGLTIITRKPEFQTWTLITAAPRNPTVQITFNHAGQVVDVQFRVSSGHADVDRAIFFAVYGWRAEGQPLSTMKPGETLTETIQFLLTRRR